MKKLGLLSICLTLLVGCSSKAATVEPSAEPTVAAEAVSVEGLQILGPTGAPGYALLPIALEGNNTITLQDGADALQAAFVNPSPEYDVIIAPTNLGTKLASAGKTTYKLAGIVTTGNLYIVGSDAEVLNNADATIAVFGENAVPGLLFNTLYGDIACKVEWYDSVSAAQAALLSNNADAALLADPAATATIAKGKEKDLTLTKIADIQQEWGSEGYPQAAMFVKEDTIETNAAMYRTMLEEMRVYAEGENDIAADLTTLENNGVDLYTDSVAYPMVQKSYAGMGIHPYAITEDAKANIQSFLDLFGVTLADDALANLD